MGIINGVLNALDKAISPISDEDAYRMVADELEADHLDKGLWTKALADCGFDRDRARAAYVKARVAEIHRAAVHDDVSKRSWYKNVEENAFIHLNQGEYDLAAIGFVERVKHRSDTDAMHNLGWLAENGHVPEANHETAIGWYRKAVDNGRHASALSISAAAERQGHFKEAYDWANYAVQKGVPGAREVRARAAKLARIKLHWWD